MASRITARKGSGGETLSDSWREDLGFYRSVPALVPILFSLAFIHHRPKAFEILDSWQTEHVSEKTIEMAQEA